MKFPHSVMNSSSHWRGCFFKPIKETKQTNKKEKKKKRGEKLQKNDQQKHEGFFRL